MKRTIMILALALCLASFASAIVIPAGSCSQITLNQSYNPVDFANWTILNVSLSETVCADNTTTNVTHTFNVNLFTGQTQSGEQGNCKYNFACLALNASNSTQTEAKTCTINKNLDPGENYTNTQGGCDVKFKCDIADDYEPPQFERSVSSNHSFKAIRELNSDIIEIRNSTDHVIMKLPVSKAFSQQFDLSFTCPAYNIADDLAQNPEFARLTCSEYQPIMYAHITLLEDSVRERDKALTECQAQKAEISTTLQTCEYKAGRSDGAEAGRNEAVEAKLNASEVYLLECRDQNAVAKGESTTYQWLFIFSVLGNMSLAALLYGYHQKLKGRKRGE